MLDYKQRLQVEKSELEEKVVKLELFINENKIFKSLEPIKQFLLKKQLSEMKSYLETLNYRIELENK